MSKSRSNATARVAKHRARASAVGSRRVEVTVPERDVGLVRSIAGVLRRDGAEAARLRETVGEIVAPAKARTGVELVAFFRSAPLVGDELDLTRDPSPGRPIDLE